MKFGPTSRRAALITAGVAALALMTETGRAQTSGTDADQGFGQQMMPPQMMQPFSGQPSGPPMHMNRMQYMPQMGQGHVSPQMGPPAGMMAQQGMSQQPMMPNGPMMGQMGQMGQMHPGIPPQPQMGQPFPPAPSTMMQGLMQPYGQQLQPGQYDRFGPMGQSGQGPSGRAMHQGFQGIPPQAQMGYQQQMQSFQQAQQDISAKVTVTSASRLLNRRVVDTTGRRVGRTNYLMIGTDTGDVRYLVLGSGGALDIGQDLIVVPWSAVTVPPGEDNPIRLTISARRLRDAPRVNRETIADVTRPMLLTQIQNYYAMPEEETTGGSGTGGTADSQQNLAGTQQQQGGQGTGNQSDQSPSVNPQEPGMPHLLVGRRIITMLHPPVFVSPTQLTGTEVVTPTGTSVGTIEQLVIDTDRGEVAYVLLARGGFLGMEEHWTPVPFLALQWAPNVSGYVLNVADAQLPSMLTLRKQDLPAQVNTADLVQLYALYGVPPYWMGGTESVATRPMGGATGQTEGQQSSVPLSGQEQQSQQAQQAGQGRQAQQGQAMGGSQIANNLIGKDVRTEDGQTVGRVTDVIISPQGNQIDRIVVATEGIQGTSKEIGIPWQEARVGNNGNTVIVSMSSEEIANAEPIQQGEQQGQNRSRQQQPGSESGQQQ